MDASYYLKKVRNDESSRRSKYISWLFTRTLVSVIFVLVSVIFVNFKEGNKEVYKKYVFTESASFHKFNEVYEKYMGKFIDSTQYSDDEVMVFSETLTYRSSEKYLDGYALEVGINYLMPAIQSGIVVFNGEKEGYGDTLIIQGVDGVDTWYVGVNEHDIELYDYIERGSLLGEVKNEDMIMVLVKDGEYLSVDEYIKKS